MGRFTSRLLRSALVAGATVATVAATTATPAIAQQSEQRFFAEFQDDCVYAATEGILTWPDPDDPSLDHGVRVIGGLTEQNQCAPDERRVFAEFTAKAAERTVDYHREFIPQFSPTPPWQYQFVLRNTVDNQLIDQVDVRVCRDLGPWLPTFVCGERQTYHPPPTTG